MDSLVLLPDGHTCHAPMAKLACSSSSQLPDPSEPLVSYRSGGSQIAWSALMHMMQAILPLLFPRAHVTVGLDTVNQTVLNAHVLAAVSYQWSAWA